MESRPSLLRLLVLTAVFALSAVSPLRAYTTWFVKQGVVGTPPLGQSWANPYTTVEQAIAAASPNDEIWCAEGVYIPVYTAGTPNAGFEIFKPLQLFGGFKGTETSVQGRLGSFLKTILDGNIGVLTDPTDNVDHVVEIEIQGAGVVVLDGFLIRNGWGVNLSTGSVNGVGISSIDTDLDLANCFVQSNGIQPPTAPANLGAGLYFTGGASTSRTLRIKNCEFKENLGLEGGAIFAENKVTGEVVNTQILSNTSAQHGGGVCLKGMGTTNRLDFTNCVFWNNHDVNYGGGLALIDSTSDLGGNARLVNCTFADNSTGYSTGGQAMYISANSLATIHNSIFFWNNTSGPGGPAPIVGTATITYSDVEGITPGTYGNKSVDPKFANHSPVRGFGPGSRGAGSEERSSRGAVGPAA